MAFLITAVLAAAATQSAQTTQVAYSKHHYPTRRAAKAVQAAACPATVASSGYVSLRDFGALGEGKKDDSDALRQAINMTHLCGGSVLIPQGKYLINSTVALHHVSLFGAGMSVPSEIGTAYATGRTVTLFTLSKEPIFSIGMRNVTVSYASDVYLEGLDIEGITIAVTVCNVDWVRIRNCGLRAAWDPSFKGDNAALVVANSYWIWVEEGSAVELRASMDNPSVILRGNDDDVAYIRSTYLVRFDRVTFKGGGVEYQQLSVQHATGGNWIYFQTICMEDSTTPLFHVWVDPKVDYFVGLEQITIIDYMNADAQYGPGGTNPMVPVIGWNVTTQGGGLDGVTLVAVSGPQVAGKAAAINPAIMSYGPNQNILGVTIINGHNSGARDVVDHKGNMIGRWTARNAGGGWTTVSDGSPNHDAILSSTSPQAFTVGRGGDKTASFGVRGDGTMMWGDGGEAPFDTVIRRPLSHKWTWAPGVVEAGTTVSTTVKVGNCDPSCTGWCPACPQPADVVSAAFSALGSSTAQLTAHVASSGVVVVVLRNDHAGATDLDLSAGGTARILVTAFDD